MKVSELSGALLDYWMLRAEGWVDDRLHDLQLTRNGEYCIAGVAPKHAVNGHCWRSPSTDWTLAGVIIELERIVIAPAGSPVDGDFEWRAQYPRHPSDDWNFYGPTPLIAAMRAFVCEKFGLEVPDV